MEYKTEKQTRQNKNKPIDAEQQVGGGEGRWREGKIGKRCVKYMIMDENYTYGGEHDIVYTDIKL